MLRNKYSSIETKPRHNYNTTINEDEEEKNHKRHAAFLSNTFQGFTSGRPKPPELSYFKNFQGFFNKKFNLTSFKQERDDSR